MLNLRSSKLKSKHLWVTRAEQEAVMIPKLLMGLLYLAFHLMPHEDIVLISFWRKCLTLRLSVVHESELLTCLSSRAWVSWVSKRDSTDIAWLLVGWKVGSTSIPGIGPANHQTAAPRKPNGPVTCCKVNICEWIVVPVKFLDEWCRKRGWCQVQWLHENDLIMLRSRWKIGCKNQRIPEYYAL